MEHPFTFRCDFNMSNWSMLWLLFALPFAGVLAGGFLFVASGSWWGLPLMLAGGGGVLWSWRIRRRLLAQAEAVEEPQPLDSDDDPSGPAEVC